MSTSEKTTLKNPWILFICLAITPLMTSIDFLAVNIAIEPMAKSLGIGISTLQWFLTAYAIGNSSFLIPAGQLANIYGRKQMLRVGLLLFILSSVAISFSSNVPLIILSRFLQGVSGGIMTTVSIAILTNLHEGSERSKWLAKFVTMAGLGFILGPILGGYLIHIFSWKAIFLINLPIGLISLTLSKFYVPYQPIINKGDKVGYLNILLFIISLFLLTTGLSQGHYWGWTNLKTLIVFSLFLIFIILFFYHQKKSNIYLIKFSLFKTKNFLASNILSFILYFIFIPWILIFGIFLQKVIGLNPMSTGVHLIPLSIAIAIMPHYSSKFIKVFGTKKLIIFGYIIGTISLFCLAFSPSESHYYEFAILFFIFGSYFGVVNSCAMSAALEFSSSSETNLESGITMMMRWLGGALGSAVMSTFFVGVSLNYIKDWASQSLIIVPNSILQALNGIILGTQSESALLSYFKGDELNLLKLGIKQIYHYGLFITMLSLGILSILGLIIAKVWIKEK